MLCYFMVCFLMVGRPPRSTRTDTLFPYTTHFRSKLVLWAGPGEDRDAVDDPFEVPIRKLLDIQAGHHLRIVGEIELARDGECGCGMVAGDHLDVDPGGAALGDRLFRFKARWIDEADKSEQLDARHDVVERDPHCIRWHLLRAQCEDALALVSSVRDGRSEE